MAKKAKPVDAMQADNSLSIQQSPDETGAQALARKLLQPSFKNAVAASAFTDKALGSGIEKPGLADYATHVQSMTGKAAGGDLDMASRILSAQAIALDSMFAELARRTALNMGEYINAAERYGRLALKAQSNCRATLDTLAKLHQPREQTVRHVHVNEGGQAVIADQFHHHTGAEENAETADQSDATGAAGASPALPSPDPLGSGVPIPGGTNPGAPEGNRNAFKHGGRSAATVAAARYLRELARLVRENRA
ncbi:MAG: hypothetical protein ABL914_09325 [Novosphingobium sp.]|uniref:hypothetical protein n=1 Tax=Novosphingobium sp. TaxID=1874826 RepID=UPI0032BD7FA7